MPWELPVSMLAVWYPKGLVDGPSPRNGVAFGLQIAGNLADVVHAPSYVHDAGAGGAQLFGHGRVVAQGFKEVHQGIANLVEDGLEAALGEFRPARRGVRLKLVSRYSAMSATLATT